MKKKAFACWCGWGSGLLGSHCAIFWVFVSMLLSFLAISWQEGTCLVHSTTHYKFTSTSTDDNGNEMITMTYYSRLNVLVNISNAWVPGFACGFSGDRSFGDYETCKEGGICGKELMLPSWSCSDCEECASLLTGQPQSCLWNYHSAGVNVEPEDWPAGFRPEYPVSGVGFLHAVLGKEVARGLEHIIVIGISGGFILLLVGCLSCLLVYAKYH